uniref:Uncharacterized protein n=1 Tax=Lynx canadensis TaxID=61383 RepID=A0A667ICH1_LYNCA
MSSKVSHDTQYEVVKKVLHGNQCTCLKFLEMVEFQIILKNNDAQKDKCFWSTHHGQAPVPVLSHNLINPSATTICLPLTREREVFCELTLHAIALC